jgi:type II secretory pathway pseudopilin PulG
VQLLSHLKRHLEKTQGFTLIEMLVVAPIAVITIATLISLMVALVGDVAVSRERSVSSYSVQSALDRIEQDARVATTYMPTFSILTSPQGRDGNTAQFTTTSGDIIMSQYATTASPYDASRQIVYYADQPNPCSGSYTLNRPLTVRVIYFTTGTAGNQTLWRRTIVPPYSTTSSDTTHVCAQPWQRDNCPAPVTISSTCQAEDEKILDNVSTFTTTYYTNTGATTTDVRNAASLKVSLTQTIQIAGETVATNGVTRGSHINVTTDNVPTAPSISVYNASINTYNNPILTTFAWDVVQNAAVYSVRYQINGGAWVNAPDQIGTQFQVTSARPRDTIVIRVASKNDMGTSAETAYTYTTPLWTVANLENDWDCYQPTETTWACPSYTLTDSGLVVLRGLATGGANSTSVFTLPSGLRINQEQIFPSWVADDFGRVDALPDGRIMKYLGPAGYVALDNVRYLAVGTPGITWNTASIYTVNGWSAYGGSYQVPRYTMDGSGRVHIVGLLTGSSADLAAGQGMISFGSGYSPPTAAIYPGIASSAYYANQVNSTNALVARSQGAANGWDSLGAIYYPSGTSVTQTNLPLQNSWVNYSTASYNGAQYAKGPDGVVSLRGLIKSGVTTRFTSVGTLPAGYRPAKRLLFMTGGINTTGGYAGQIPARLDVFPDGTIQILNLASDSLGNGWLSLEGIHFYAEQ